jgi:hypothetical protein
MSNRRRDVSNALARSVLLNLGDLEAARDQLLENTFGVVLLCSSFHLLHVLWTIACKRILLLVRIAHVQVRVIGANAFGIRPDIFDEVRASRLEECILL